MKTFFQRLSIRKDVEDPKASRAPTTPKTFGSHFQYSSGGSLPRSPPPPPISGSNRLRSEKALHRPRPPPSNFATIEDLPQEILDAILVCFCPASQPTHVWTSDAPIDELVETLQWLRKLAFLNHKWFYAVRPLFLSFVIVAASAKRSHLQVAFAKLHSQTIRRVVLDCRYSYDGSEDHRAKTLASFKECLGVCTNLRILDVVCLNEILLDADAQSLTRDLFSHISSDQFRTLAIRTRSTDLLLTNVTTLHILDAMTPEVVQNITDLEIQSLTGPTNSGTLETSFPSLQRLTLSRISPRSLDSLFEFLPIVTRPGRRSTSLSEVSFSSTYIRLSTIERLLNVNNLGETLLSFKCSVSWVDPANDLPLAPSAIFALCPRLETLHLFAPCPTSIFTHLPPSLIELGVLVMKDSRLPVISSMDTVVAWANDSVMRKNVRNLVMRWYLDDHRKYHDQRVLRRTKLDVAVFFGKSGWTV
ncbi:hypothetical protein BDN72DRAFT_834185 [Pluteus cervinus]|uniref:Uncharacterized protein n=1 Tax=Pluteus cervinus TaxID=181527 RepID=A0ACD3B884_9AGAR|nr:hypothetical protein BDN72DRAFT_834185 [Pluteus cervinus]